MLFLTLINITTVFQCIVLRKWHNTASFQHLYTIVLDTLTQHTDSNTKHTASLFTEAARQCLCNDIIMMFRTCDIVNTASSPSHQAVPQHSILFVFLQTTQRLRPYLFLRQLTELSTCKSMMPGGHLLQIQAKADTVDRSIEHLKLNMVSWLVWFGYNVFGV